MKIIADRSKCAGHARCAAVSEELFELDASGYIGFDTKVIGADSEAAARRGVRACPERALKISEDTP
jgi:ferredoxin